MKITSSKEIYRCGLFRVTEEHAADRSGFSVTRNVIRHNGSAVVLAADEKDRVLLVRQYRLPVGKQLWELPAGKIDDGETALAAARRELIEETGLRAKRWRKLVTFQPTPGFLDEKTSVYLATGLTQGDAQPMEDERIVTRWFAKKELRRMIADNTVVDAKTMIGFLHWARL